MSGITRTSKDDAALGDGPIGGFPGWLVRPLQAGPGIAARRRRLLAWLLLSMLALMAFAFVLVLAVDTSRTSRGIEYSELILLLGALFTVSYLLNAAGQYRAAAWMAVGLTIAEPWASLAVDHAVAHGDFVPMLYVAVAVLLSSFLFSPWVTVLVAVVQTGGLIGLAVLDRSAAPFNWPSALTFMVVVSALGILSSAIMQNDLAEIDEQTRQLAESEAALRELAVRDHLTGLFNRRYLEETLDLEVKRAERSASSVGVISFDLDRLKEINDASGHASGDIVLRRVGDVVSRHTRESDLACRCGGDEFVLVLPGASRDVAFGRAELLRQAVKDGSGADDEHQVTISVGVAVYPEDGVTGEAVLCAADEALYRAKRTGRDRTDSGAQPVLAT